MIADKILPLLEKVREKGPSSWLACCPAHDDKNPSLGITEKDGVVLLHCFSGNCSVFDIVQAVGLEASDLFPEKIKIEGSPPIKKKRFPAELVLAALGEEMTIVELGLMTLSKGHQLNDHAQQMMGRSAKLFRAGRQAGGW